jgi:hypothetical protein
MSYCIHKLKQERCIYAAIEQRLQLADSMVPGRRLKILWIHMHLVQDNRNLVVEFVTL